MADHVIVSCPGCGKRYSVPPGVPPGQFQCQDCSAVVAYGRGGEVAEPPKGGGSGRTRAKAAAAKKRMQRGRRDDGDDDDDRGRRGSGGSSKDSKSATPYILGFVTVAVLAGFIAFAVNKTSTAPPGPAVAAGPKVPSAAGGLGVIGGTAPLPDAPPSTAPAPAYTPPPPPPKPAPETPRAPTGIQTAVRSAGVEQKADSYKEAANLPTGGNYGKSQNQLLMMLKDRRASVITPLDHLPDTPPELQSKIDDAVSKILDVNSGTAAIRARDVLIKIGRPAIPRVLSAFVKLDFSRYGDIVGARDECVVADYADEVLREITAYPKAMRLQFSPEARLSNYQAAGEEWYVWWLTIGYKRETFYKKAAEDEDE